MPRSEVRRLMASRGHSSSRTPAVQNGRTARTAGFPCLRAGLTATLSNCGDQRAEITHLQCHGRTPMREDPAERAGYLRFFYRRWRPTFVGRVWTRILAFMAGLGLLPGDLVSVQTSDSRSGRPHAHVLVPVTFEGQRYLVSMLGEGSNWVQDIRAMHGSAFLKRGRVHPVVLTEIPPDKRAPVLRAWCQVATSGRGHLPVSYDAPLSAFEAIATDYPVFRIDAAPKTTGI